MIEIQSLCREYGDLVEVRDLNISILDNEVYGLIGPFPAPVPTSGS